MGDGVGRNSLREVVRYCCSLSPPYGMVMCCCLVGLSVPFLVKMVNDYVYLKSSATMPPSESFGATYVGTECS